MRSRADAFSGSIAPFPIHPVLRFPRRAREARVHRLPKPPLAEPTDSTPRPSAPSPAPPPPASRARRFARGLGAFALGIAASAVLGEIALRAYNPVDVRILESEIRLPVRRKIVYRNAASPKLDREIVCSRNILGFRGPDPPADFDDRLTIVTVGGSTTDCRYLSDGKTWPDRLRARIAVKHPDVWLNNAGLDGHSTFGHTILLDQVLLDLAPDCIILLVGLNDTDRTDLNRRDALLTGTHTRLGRTVDASELLSTMRVVSRSVRARKMGLEHVLDLDLAHLEVRDVSEEEIERRVEFNRRKEAVPAYAARLRRFVAKARSGGIEPILVTQPALFGEGADPATGVDLGPLVFARVTSSEMWRVIEIYNDVTRSVGSEENVLVVDLARLLPKDSAYFYDWMHFTNEGALRVAEILDHETESFFASRAGPASRGLTAGRDSAIKANPRKFGKKGEFEEIRR